MNPRFIELLAPARDINTGIAAINFGADAVYIGGPKFGARSAVGNSISDIEKLANYAHRYRSKVFVALNTILFDKELKEAEQIIHQVYQAGADALIIQDMGILEMSLPPISLHASTQCDNRTHRKVDFLEKAGFSRVVLARELSLSDITEISKNTTIELEAFVHGALCVCFSGQCYMSQFVGGRSANRGECAQPCRLPYSLLDSQNRVITENSHQLSLKDMNRSASLGDMIGAGITSLKIEGRLKDINYVKNITAYYRNQLDSVLDGNQNFKKSSIGKTIFTFTPEPENSFNRHFTNYFLDGRSKDIASPESPKSLGKFIGTVEGSDANSLWIKTNEAIHNGDGLCFFNVKNDLEGIRVNRAEGNRIFLFEACFIAKGTKIYRNYDHQFIKTLESLDNARTIEIQINLDEFDAGFSINAKILGEEIESSLQVESEKQLAQKPEMALQNIISNLSKSSDSVFKIAKVEVLTKQVYFFKPAFLNDMRRKVVEKLLENLVSIHQPIRKEFQPNDFAFPEQELGYNANITNRLAKAFYERHGAKILQMGFEVKLPEGRKTLMTTKHCLKYQHGLCPKFDKQKHAISAEPMFIVNKEGKFLLEFDCKNCVMLVIKE